MHQRLTRISAALMTTVAEVVLEEEPIGLTRFSPRDGPGMKAFNQLRSGPMSQLLLSWLAMAANLDGAISPSMKDQAQDKR